MTHCFADVGLQDQMEINGHLLDLDPDLTKMTPEQSAACVEYLAATSTLDYLRNKRLEIIRSQMRTLHNAKIPQDRKDRAMGNLNVMETHTIAAIDRLAFGEK